MMHNFSTRFTSALFTECFKWQLFPPHDFTTFRNGTVVLYKPANITYRLGEFLLAGDGSVFVCIPPELQPNLYPLDYMAVLVRCLSVITLLLSIAVNAWVVTDIQSKYVYPILCHKLTLVFFYTCTGFCIANFCGHNDLANDIMVSVCLYFVRVSYCWINVISRDMWLTFHPRAILRRPSTISLGGSLAIHRFAFQSIYAFGFPAVLVGVSLLLGLAPLPDLRPWTHAGPLSQNLAQVIYMTITVCVIVFANAVFCILIIHNLRRIRRGSNHQLLNIKDRNNEMFQLYVKLVVVSGLLYFFEIGQYVAGRYGKFSIYWVIPDWIANSQGVWLFIVYSCNKSVRNAVYKKLKKISNKDEKSSSGANSQEFRSRTGSNTPSQ